MFHWFSIKQQKMYHQKEGKTVKTYVISTSLKSPSCEENSLGTPWGLHEVCEVIGSGQPKEWFLKVASQLIFATGNVMIGREQQI